MQCFRIKIQDQSFKDLVNQVQQVATASMANQDVPFENVVAKLGKDRELSRNPLVQIIFVVHSQLNLNRFNLEGLEAETIPAPPASALILSSIFTKRIKHLVEALFIQQTSTMPRPSVMC